MSPGGVTHLGQLIGHPDADRIVALSTSAVFSDTALLSSQGPAKLANLDSGQQAHLYTRPQDILVVRVPAEPSCVTHALAAIDLNYDIWHSLTGIELLSSQDRIIFATDQSAQLPRVPSNVSWHCGSLLDAAIQKYRTGEQAFLAFTFTHEIAVRLGLDDDNAPRSIRQARATSRFMNKNQAMRVVEAAAVPCAKTYQFDEGTDVEALLGRLPEDRYVFKPAGGAAGLMVFTNDGIGADPREIREHLSTLSRDHRLPSAFQIQQFLTGALLGVSACIADDGTFEVFEVHLSRMDAHNRFVGARWSWGQQEAYASVVNHMYQRLTDFEPLDLPFMACLDFIDGRVIEVNPRATAGAAISHLLRLPELEAFCGPIQQIDLNTQLPIPYQNMQNGGLVRAVEQARRHNGTVVLPQGLNPFGKSRIAFVNDDSSGSAQRAFVRSVTT